MPSPRQTAVPASPAAGTDDDVLESLRDAVLILDREWRITRLNASARSLLSPARASFPNGTSLWEALPTLEGTPCAPLLREGLAAKRSVETEFCVSGQDAWYKVRMYPLNRGSALFLREVSARRKRLEALDDLASRLSRTSGNAFFQELVARLAEIAQADSILVGRFLPGQPLRAQLLSAWNQPRGLGSNSLEIEGTPIAGLAQEGQCVISSGASRQFAALEAGGAGAYEGLVGVGLRTEDGEMLGFIATLHRGRLPDPLPILDACRLFATRAAGELAHQSAIDRLRNSEERFKLLAKATTDVVWDCDLLTGSVWRSEAFDTLLGVNDAKQKLSLTDIRARIHPDDRDRVEASLATAIQGPDMHWQGEYRLIRHDGTHAFILDRAMIIRDASGQAVRIVGGMTDMSDRIEAASRLREQAELLNRASDAIVVCDLQHNIQYWNQGAERLFGWSGQEAVGCNALELFRSSRESLLRAAEEVRAREEWSSEMTKRDKKGKDHVLSSRWTLIRGPAGEARAFLNIDTDITEKKQLESQFLRAQRLESIGVLAGGIAHDLNNVLTPITMAVDLLRRKHPEGETARLLGSIESCAERGADLVRQVLGFARGVGGKRLLINPAFVAGDITRIARDTFPKSIRIKLDCTRDPWLVVGDPTQLHQILMNLCVNARDAMTAGGELRLKVENILLGEPLRGVIGTMEPGSYCALAVSDTGTGIPPDILDKIFDPFFTTKPQSQGTGLGLSTLLAIVRSHEGDLTVQSELGVGSSFRVFLPARMREAVQPEGSAPPANPLGHGECLLVVDDEAHIRNIARQTLESHGYQVITASNGAEALTAFLDAPKRISLVVTDMMMPVMDGPALIRALRRIDSHVPLLAASGMNADATIERARAAGATDFVEKPFSAGELLTRVASLVSKP